MLILAGTVRIASGKRAAALGPMHSMVEATRAEPGCLSYAFSFDLNDDHLVRIFELFEDERALAAHRTSSHMAAWRAACAELGIGERDLTQYEIGSARKI